MTALEMWGDLGSFMAALMFARAMFKQYFPFQLRMHVEAYALKAVGHVYPYVQIKFPEFAGERLEQCEAYTQKLFTKKPSSNWSYPKASQWSHVAFKHPSTFDTLAMKPSKKREIMNDLLKFWRGKEYYDRISKVWKRGYLLYGPPGTGKSTMIAVMANFLNHDMYDLELTTVKDNMELRKLLIDTSEKSIIVIEDIDCSLNLTGQRKTKKQEKEDDEEKADPVEKMAKGGEESKESKVMLSGLLNFIDELWSKLDSALISRGRMDKHIEMLYCCFESFKVLVRNYLGIKSHPLFARVRRLLQEMKMTLADVAENLMSKSDDEDKEACLEGLIEVLEKAKEDAKNKSEEEKATAVEAEAIAARAWLRKKGNLHRVKESKKTVEEVVLKK
ncbi:hypothetical protein EUGRSUZ_L00794 [Eucalyptus grandis]|uniref:Uncharacterized protein n=1 Tax=Eucalyptus grandis TaxID=71139 RepID=A0A058ZVN0_EUCGR|nr:hypothetical protein EUGRSUZ_L00794 [Eucalyptus grandis]